MVENQLREARAELIAIKATVGFRALQSARRFLVGVCPPGTLPGRLLATTLRGIDMLQVQGWKPFLRRLARPNTWLAFVVKPQLTAHDNIDSDYVHWQARHEPARLALAEMRRVSDGWARRPKISVIMPVFNTDPDHLSAAIESVIAQAYTNWELCLVDDASTLPVRPTIEQYRDLRIRPAYRERNGGIAAATNSAIEFATGDYLAFLDHDDILKPHALYEVARHIVADPECQVIYSDEDKLLMSGRNGQPFFKPDWSPDLLLSMNYLNHLSVVSTNLVKQVGGLRQHFEGSQDYDLMLRVTEHSSKVCHIPLPLYTWRQVKGSVALDPEAKLPAYFSAKRALEEAVARRKIEGSVEFLETLGRYRVRYSLQNKPLVSIIIPTRDRLDLLERCIRSIEAKTTYNDYELLIVNNRSNQPSTLEYLSRTKHKVIKYDGDFNFSLIMNYATQFTNGSHLIFLNNDTEVITPDWIEALLEHSQRPTVGPVGARLFYPTGQVQHEGIVLGLRGHFGANVEYSYFQLGDVVRNCSAVTAACMMIEKTKFNALSGFDERLKVNWNDVDLCLRARDKGWSCIYTPYAALYHIERATRGGLGNDNDNLVAVEKWGQPTSERDPYYSLNFDTSVPFRLAQISADNLVTG